jgi:hypothetical protein
LSLAETGSAQAHRRAGAVDKHRKLVASAKCRGQESVSRLVTQRQRIDIVTLGGARPTSLRQHHSDRFSGHQQGLVQCLRGVALNNSSAAFVAVGLSVLKNFLFIKDLSCRAFRTCSVWPFLRRLCCSPRIFISSGFLGAQA